jgi:hypothetical protein
MKKHLGPKIQLQVDPINTKVREIISSSQARLMEFFKFNGEIHS